MIELITYLAFFGVICLCIEKRSTNKKIRELDDKIQDILDKKESKMRDLSKRQKKMIDTWFSENWTGDGSITGAEDIDAELFDKIERLNNFENLWQSMRWYVTSKIAKKMYC